MTRTKEFVLTEKMYKSLIKRGMDLRCQCTIGGNGPCGCMLMPFDYVVSKPSRHGRKYYLYAHYQRMRIDLNQR